MLVLKGKGVQMSTISVSEHEAGVWVCTCMLTGKKKNLSSGSSLGARKDSSSGHHAMSHPEHVPNRTGVEEDGRTHKRRPSQLARS